jgi:hypothetical protein
MDKKIFVSKTKDYIKEYNKQRYISNREKLLVLVAKRSFCDSCNCEVVTCKLNTHNRTNKHINNQMNNKLNELNESNEIDKQEI